ncbi:Spo0E family sporulation regulatory protein-aspartic acid phosphatase [Peribacillus sp. SCS-37]|uniref:Spo0E family sporulation regulatory protein-aspartic acid phosphatase n=1 Tax=Paraperibacillus esterisolvens TaxID=3115296 RepID=UPI0039062E26
MIYQCTCKTPTEIEERIDQLRSEMIQSGSTDGLLASSTIELSRQLDACIYKYQTINSDCRTN